MSSFPQRKSRLAATCKEVASPPKGRHTGALDLWFWITSSNLITHVHSICYSSWMKITSAEFVKGIKGTDEILANGVPQIAFIGRSNVGKSSILNALTDKKDLAQVGKKPGKTTEINFFLIDKTQYFVDLPGYGYASKGLKDREKLRKLIIWYFTSGEARPRKTVLILEAKAGLTKFDEQMIEVLKEQGLAYVIVLNKVDKLSQKKLSEQMTKIEQIAGGSEILQTSIKTGRGIDALRYNVLGAVET